DTLPVVLLYDGRREGLPADIADELQRIELHHAPDPVFAYDTHHQADPATVERAILQALEQHGCDPAETVVHVHNHALGKNAALTAALARLADRGWRLLLHVHDFTEDFRPKEFDHLRNQAAVSHGGWYPQCPNVHYATLNARDRALLDAAGVASERLHLLPNPVLPDPPGDPAAGRAALQERFGDGLRPHYRLYPVRGIARKQVGELLLLAALAPPDVCYGMSLAPANPWQRPPYDRWGALARELELPVLFETGATPGLRFSDHMACAEHIVSTSIAEGFGMAFLESCLSGHLIVGRDLPEITADFVAEGLRFPGLYERLLIPVDWVGVDRWRRDLGQAYRAVLEAYRQALPQADRLAEECSDLLVDGLADFATFTTPLQEEVVARCARDPAAAAQLRQINPPPLDRLAENTRAGVIVANRRAVEAGYSMRAIGQRLHACYRSLLAAGTGPVAPLPEPQRLLGGFLALDRFAPVRILAA
ncbi:MAG: hypothetical protein ACOCXJ_04775, partial [Planctomycetota bacterium]